MNEVTEDMEKIEKRLTVDEFLELAERPEYQGYRLELIDGGVNHQRHAHW